MVRDRPTLKRVHPSLWAEVEKLKLKYNISSSKASKILADRINATKYVDSIKKKNNKWLSIETKIKL